MDQMTKKTPNPKCRLYLCLIEHCTAHCALPQDSIEGMGPQLDTLLPHINFSTHHSRRREFFLLILGLFSSDTWIKQI
jgi:hypothetical protein